ncbi:MAG: LysR substrate-binding domain-containing protein [Pseudomonadota bacterium]
MLDQLRQIAIFAKTVDHGSFRAAARALDISPSVVSHHIAQLEERLGAALLYRSTRKLSVTEDGKRLLAEARVMICAAEAGMQAVADRGQDLSGVLRVTVPAVLAQSAIVDRIAAFTAAHPKVRLTLDFSDIRRELIGAGIDVAIRMGWLRDSALKARKLSDVRRTLVAARSYLAARPEPRAPEDLLDWDWLELSAVPLKPEFRREDRRAVRLKPAPRLSVNDAHAIYRLARAGAGLAILPDFLSEADVRDGEMALVLPEWEHVSVGVYAVWPPNAPREGLTAHFVEALAKGGG